MTTRNQLHGTSPCRFGSLALAATIVVSAIGPMSCAATDNTVVGSTAKKVMLANAPHTGQDFAYTAGSKISTSVKVSAVIYHGSAPYVCSPSGFGQKSRCFARSSLVD